MPEKNGRGSSPASTARTGHDELIGRLLRDPRKAEAMKWLQTGKGVQQRTIGAFRKTATSARLVRKLYTLGAAEIVVAGIETPRHGRGQHAGKLVIKLPKETERRKAIFQWCQEQGDSLGFSPDLDQGESHLFLLLD